MTEYSKLTVVKLRDELEKRGLPKAGLKAALIDRLVENDAQSNKAKTASDASNEIISTATSDAPEGSTSPHDEPRPNVDNAAKPEAVKGAPGNASQFLERSEPESNTVHAAVQQPLSAQNQEQTSEELALVNSPMKAEESVLDQEVRTKSNREQGCRKSLNYRTRYYSYNNRLTGAGSV